MERTQWQELVIEKRVAPPPLSDDQFRAWMQDRPIFVSSVMDTEMKPSREAVRVWLREWGAEPVMWEAITPRDQRPQDAYLDGVERSDVVLLLLGTYYGVSDQTGFSPTHKEGNRAAELGITRLLFQVANIPSSDREGKLNNWVNSMYAEVSGGKYTDPADLIRQLDVRLREIASAQETPWIKLGGLVFPGKVRQRAADGTTEFVITALIQNPALRREVAEVKGWGRRHSADRLTWGTGSWLVEVVEVELESETISSTDIVITCRLPRNYVPGTSSVLGGMNFVEHGRTIGPSEQAVMWATQAVFGETLQAATPSDVAAWTAPNGPTLPDVLNTHTARGWVAEGLVRLYLVEGLLTNFGGAFERLKIGPATAAGVRVDAKFRPAGHDRPVASIVGIVPLPG